MTQRVDRMRGQAPDYYETSDVFMKIQTVQGDEYDSLEARNSDLKAQLRIKTATWGLVYYEEAYNIPVVETDGFAIRRSRVLSRYRGVGQFSAAMIELIAESYSGGEAAVTMDIPNGIVKVQFIGKLGVPSNLDDLKAAIDNVIHAHLGTSYSFRYLIWSELDTANYTWDEWDALGLTWAAVEVYQPKRKENK